MTFSWCLLRNARPSSDMRISIALCAPAAHVGGSDVVKMNPAAYDRITSTSNEDPAGIKQKQTKR